MIAHDASEADYNAWWQEYDMDKTGHFFEECADVVLDNYDIHINIERFLEFYLKSDMRNLIDIHHPFLSTRSNKENIDSLIKVDMYGRLADEMRSDVSQRDMYRDNELYWMGWFFIYCLYQNPKIENSRELIKVLPIDKLRELYPTFHEMDVRNCYERVFEN